MPLSKVSRLMLIKNRVIDNKTMVKTPSLVLSRSLFLECPAIFLDKSSLLHIFGNFSWKRETRTKRFLFYDSMLVDYILMEEVHNI